MEGGFRQSQRIAPGSGGRAAVHRPARGGFSWAAAQTPGASSSPGCTASAHPAGFDGRGLSAESAHCTRLGGASGSPSSGARAIFRGLRRGRLGRAAAPAALPLPTRQASMEGGCLKKGFASCSRRNFPEAALCRGGLPSGEILIPGKGAIPPGRDPSIFLFHLCRRGRGFPLCFDQQDSFRKGFLRKISTGKALPRTLPLEKISTGGNICTPGLCWPAPPRRGKAPEISGGHPRENFLAHKLSTSFPRVL